jgi:hypothetical protein
MQGRAMRIVSRSANEVFADFEVHAFVGTQPINDAANFRHDFWADPVAGKDEKGIRHGRAPPEFLLEKAVASGARLVKMRHLFAVAALPVVDNVTKGLGVDLIQK